MKRRTFITNATMAASVLAVAPFMGDLRASEDYDFPVIDLHVHTTEKFTIAQVMKLAEERKVKIGIVDHPASWAIKDDAGLKQYIDNLRKYPVYIGMQPMISGWTKNFSPQLLAQLDYVLMDPQTIPLGNGKYQQIWELETYVENTEEFMERYMEHCLNILNQEQINIFGWPLFLPVCIARDYYALWTEKRMQQIISAAKSKKIALEINDMAHTPHEKFILMAKEQGLKFTFGSDARNQNAGRLDYCKRVAKQCKLQAEDFYIPTKKS